MKTGLRGFNYPGALNQFPNHMVFPTERERGIGQEGRDQFSSIYLQISKLPDDGQ